MRTLTEKSKAKIMCNSQLHSVKNSKGMTKISDTTFEPRLKCSSFITINLFIYIFFYILDLRAKPKHKKYLSQIYTHRKFIASYILFKKNICFYLIVLIYIFFVKNLLTLKKYLSL